MHVHELSITVLPRNKLLHMLFVFAHLPIEQMPYCCSKVVALLACGKNVCHMYAVANESNSILRLFSYLQSYTDTKKSNRFEIPFYL